MLQVRDDLLDNHPRTAEGDRLDALPDPGCGDPASLQQAGATDAQGAVDQGRVVKDEAPLPAGGPVAVDELDPILLQQPLGELARIGDGGRGAEEAGGGAVEVADAPQAPGGVG